MLESKVSIKIPAGLREAVKRRVELNQGEFNNVEFVLREVVKEEEPAQAYTPEEKGRLRALGYL